jgi:hypothetical protein
MHKTHGTANPSPTTLFKFVVRPPRPYRGDNGKQRRAQFTDLLLGDGQYGVAKHHEQLVYQCHKQYACADNGRYFVVMIHNVVSSPLCNDHASPDYLMQYKRRREIFVIQGGF